PWIELAHVRTRRRPTPISCRRQPAEKERTERAIVDFVGGVPDAQLAIARLMQNQTDIGNAVKPFYGRKAGNRLTALLKEHINTAVAVLQAAASGDSQAVATAKAAFFANGDQVARLLHGANPRHWSLHAMQRMMRTHLNQVIALAVDQLRGDYAAAIRLYDAYIAHILDMADMLSIGIMQQFPEKFR
ncbi:MAG: glycosyltransferase, partial [Solirubrobacterales bacterium]